jgi:hypothetical protein
MFQWRIAMSFFKKTAIGLATVFCLASAPTEAQLSPMSPLNPLSPTNPWHPAHGGRHDGSGGTSWDQASKGEKIGIIASMSAIILIVGGLAGFTIWEERKNRRKEQKNAPKN